MRPITRFELVATLGASYNALQYCTVVLFSFSLASIAQILRLHQPTVEACCAGS
jgi:hypothetical protein